MWRDHDGGWYLDVGDGGADTIAWALHPEGTAITASPAATIALVNDAAEPGTFTIERATWSDHALRAGQLLSFQEFRDLFSEDYIGADVRLGVGEQTLLFTDVVGSTAFYAARGDPAAFVEIKKHFDEVFAIVVRRRGAVVKTIGDAVMASFTSPLDAVRAARDIHDAFHPARSDTPIRLRISLNTGVAGYLAEQGAELEVLSYTSRALPDPVGVRRWTVYRDADSEARSTSASSPPSSST